MEQLLLYNRLQFKGPPLIILNGFFWQCENGWARSNVMTIDRAVSGVNPSQQKLVLLVAILRSGIHEIIICKGLYCTTSTYLLYSTVWDSPSYWKKYMITMKTVVILGLVARGLGGSSVELSSLSTSGRQWNIFFVFDVELQNCICLYSL